MAVQISAAAIKYQADRRSRNFFFLFSLIGWLLSLICLLKLDHR